MGIRKMGAWIGLLLAGLLVLSLGPTTGAGPARGTKIVVGIDTDPPSLDAHSNTALSSDLMFAHLYDKLVGFDMRSNIVPELATEWSNSNNGLTWTFKLRRGHKFHDGTPVNAAAIKANFDRLFDPRNPFSRRTLFEMIKKIDVVDEYTVALTTDKPFGAMLNQLANPSASIVSPTAAAKQDVSTFGRFPVGSGPYFFREWVRGTRIIVMKNRAHWLADQSNVSEIEFRPIPDDATRAIGLETGELDFVTTISPQEARRLGSHPNLVAYNLPRARIQGLYPNVTKKPWSDVRVRQAMAYAIDKQAIVNTFLAGFARVADSPLPPGVFPYKAQAQRYNYDPERAKRLLAEAGYANGLSATMWVPIGTYAAAQQISEAVAEMLKKVGINLKLDVMESGQWLVLLRSKGPRESTLDMTYYGWGTQTVDADYAFRLVFHTENFAPACCNRNFYSNPELDALLDKGLSTTSPQERRAAYEKAQEILWRDLPWIWIFSVNHSAVGSRALRDVQLLPVELVHFREANISR
ncbi:MAG: ABC transporter substrate-binding protein [Armatimonadota bacterium]